MGSSARPAVPRCPPASHVHGRQSARATSTGTRKTHVKGKRSAQQKAREERNKTARGALNPRLASAHGLINPPLRCRINRCCQRARSSETNIASSIAMLGAEERGLTWLEHTLEIKDDQNKGSQTGGEYHAAYPAHPHQVAQSLFHGRTRRLLLASLGRAALLDSPRLWRCRGGGGLSAGQ